MSWYLFKHRHNFTFQVEVWWIATPCSVVVEHITALHGATTHKTST